MFRFFVRDLSPVGVSALGVLGLTVPGVSLILGVNLRPWDDVSTEDDSALEDEGGGQVIQLLEP
jgi:hypothetical protein